MQSFCFNWFASLSFLSLCYYRFLSHALVTHSYRYSWAYVMSRNWRFRNYVSPADHELSSTNDGEIVFKGIDHVGLVVSDVNKSLTFYVATLGFNDISHLRPNLPYPGAFLQCGAQQVHLMQLPTSDCMDSEMRPLYAGRDRHMAVQVFDLGVVMRRLSANNISYTVSSSGRNALFCRDPDANGFEFLEITGVVTFALSKVQFHHLRDWRLCNNGEHPQLQPQVWCQRRVQPDLENGGLYRCDSRKLSPEECRAVVLELETFSVTALVEHVPNLDEDVTLRRIIVKFTNHTVNSETTGKEIDNFIRPRLWWYVSKEPYAWIGHAQNTIVFSRVQHQFEPSLHVLSAIQYPYSTEICKQTPLLLNHRDFKHPGWYSMLVQYTSVHEEFPFAITAVYVSSENSVHDSTSFITAEDCPHEVNKWECAFLALTNCTLPELVTHCSSHDCVQKVVDDTIKVTAVFDSTSADGKSVVRGSPEYEIVKQKSKAPMLINTHLVAELAAASKAPNPQVHYQRPFHSDKAPFQSMMLMQPDFYTQNMVLRPSAFYRSRIAEAIHNFQTLNNFSSTHRCVAAQIRRGDRALVKVNITEFCLDPRNKNSDMGCNTVPFVSITLQHVVDSAAKLVEPSVRSLIVTTDDEGWLETEKIKLRETHPEWRVYSMKAPHHTQEHSDSPAPLGALNGDAEYNYMRYGAGTASGVLLHGSIQLSRQCEAFVGHFGCGGTMLVYKSLCAQHNHKEYVCPPSFDLRTITELQIYKQ